ATGTKRPDRSWGRWLGLGNWGMGEIFDFAFMRHRVRHGALTMRLRSHVRSAVKTASWRAFAAVDTFGLVWLFSGHDTTHAIAAAGAVVGVEAITKSFLYFAHERLHHDAFGKEDRLVGQNERALSLPESHTRRISAPSRNSWQGDAILPLCELGDRAMWIVMYVAMIASLSAMGMLP